MSELFVDDSGNPKPFKKMTKAELKAWKKMMTAANLGSKRGYAKGSRSLTLFFGPLYALLLFGWLLKGCGIWGGF